jgi:predicted metal-dependent phosphoesterase TrpH
VTSTIYDARNFRLDLIKELERRNSPRYPQRDFWRALELADSADVTRAVTAINASEDAYYFDRQQSRQFSDLDDVDPKYLIAGYSPERAAERAERMAYARQFKKGVRAIPQPEAICS